MVGRVGGDEVSGLVGPASVFVYFVVTRCEGWHRDGTASMRPLVKSRQEGDCISRQSRCFCATLAAVVTAIRQMPCGGVA